MRVTKNENVRLYDKACIKLEEREVIESVRGGDSTRFGWIVERYSRQVFTLCRSITGDSEVAQEVVQDIFLKVYNNIGSWRGDCAFSTWIYRVAYNTAISSRRHRKSIATLGVESMERIEVALEAFDEQREARYVALEAALAKLKVEDRTIINMYYYDNKSVEELAYILNMSESNVKTKLFRIRKKLSDLMQ